MRKQIILLTGLAMLVSIASACGKGGGKSDEGTQGSKQTPDTTPVTVKLFSLGAGINNEQDMNDLFAKPLQAKYPNITVELVKAKDLDELITTGNIPDLIATSNYYLIDPIEKGLGSDLSDFVKKEKIDLTKFEPEAVNVIKNFGKNGEFYGMPFSLNYGMVAYNKDIFDKFGVAYPKDNMTWTQMVDLAKRVTRLEGADQYVGLDPGPALSLVRARSLPLLDNTREKAAVTTDGFKQVFSVFKSIYDIPGELGPNNKLNYGVGFFLKDKKLALYPYWISAFTTQLVAPGDPGKQLNWDIVTYPSYDDKPGLGREIDFHLLMVTPQSKNKEAAYKVISALVSDDAQKAMNNNARMTILKDLNLRKQFASSMNVYQGKNLAGIFKVNPAPLPPSSPNDVKIYGILGEALKSMVVDKKDINTVLQTANEQSDKAIQDSKKK